MLVMQGSKTIGTNTQHRRLLLAWETFLILEVEDQQWQLKKLGRGLYI